MNDSDHLEPCCSWREEILQEALACPLLSQLLGRLFGEPCDVASRHVDEVAEQHALFVVWVLPLRLLLIDPLRRHLTSDGVNDAQRSELSKQLSLGEEIGVIDVGISVVLDVLQ